MSCGLSTRATGQLLRPRGAESVASRKAATAPSTSRCTTRWSSRSSRAGRATRWPRTTTRSSDTASRVSASNTPLDQLSEEAGTLRDAHTYFWFYTGTDDSLRNQNRAFAAALSTARVPHTYLELKGGHNWALWRGMARRSYLAAARRLEHA